MSLRIILPPAIWLAILLAPLGVVGYVNGQQLDEPLPSLYAGTPLDAMLLRLDRQALEEAYHDQIKKLFSVWIASGAPADATNLRNGLQIARRAYDGAIQQISRREQELLEQGPTP